METDERNFREGMVALLESARTEIAVFHDELSSDKADVARRFDVLQAEIRAIIQDIKHLNEGHESEHQEIESGTASLEKQVNSPGLSENLKAHLSGMIDTLGHISASIEKKIMPHRWGGVYDRLQRTQIKLNILRLKLKLGKLRVAGSLNKKNKEFQDRVNEVKKSWENTGAKAREGWKCFSTGMRDLYRHVQDTFTKN